MSLFDSIRYPVRVASKEEFLALPDDLLNKCLSGLITVIYRFSEITEIEYKGLNGIFTSIDDKELRVLVAFNFIKNRAEEFPRARRNQIMDDMLKEVRKIIYEY